MSQQKPPGVTGTPKNTPKSTPKVLKPVGTYSHNKPTGAVAPSGKQGRG